VYVTLTNHKGDACELCARSASLLPALTREEGARLQTLGSYKRLHGWGPSWMHVYRLTRTVPEVAAA
jgi:hypothetical protein